MKIKTTLKNAFIETFEELDGVDNLVEWARANQTELYRMGKVNANH